MSAKTVFEGDHLYVKERDGWQYVERKKATEAVAVIAETDDARIILTEQFRRPVNARVIDFAAGLVGDEEDHSDPAATARKELEEETGYTAERVERLASGPSSPGITSEIVTFYRAYGLRKRGGGGGIGGEDIVVHEIPLASLAGWLQAREGEGILIDLKIWAGLYFLSKK
jgi:ADP-ribose pyrophosphatase